MSALSTIRPASVIAATLALSLALPVSATLSSADLSARSTERGRQVVAASAQGHTKDVHCGGDRSGGLYAKVPNSWTPTRFSLTHCRWTSPDQVARIDLRLRAPSLARQRANLAARDVDYVEYIFERTRQWLGPAKLWGFTATTSHGRRRHIMVQEFDFRLEYSATAGRFTDHLHAYQRARATSGAAG
jgi:hypothetical protein